MLFASRYGNIYALSSTALDVLLTFYKVEIEKEKKKDKRRKSRRSE
jgi:hypothetical protein